MESVLEQYLLVKGLVNRRILKFNFEVVLSLVIQEINNVYLGVFQHQFSIFLIEQRGFKDRLKLPNLLYNLKKVSLIVHSSPAFI